MLDLDDRSVQVDYLTLIDELDRTERLAASGGTTYVAGLLGVVPTPIHAEHYARMVADAAFMRRLISVGGKIATLGFEGQLDPDTALARSEQLLADVRSATATGGLRPQLDVIRSTVEMLEARFDPDRASMLAAGILPTTFRDLDAYLSGGFARGDLVLLAGRPGMGKSSLMLAIVAGAAQQFRLRCAIFTLEMSEEALALRQLAAASGIPLVRFRDGTLSEAQQLALGRALGTVAELDLWWDQSATQTLASIRSKARRLAQAGDLHYIVVDHLQLVDGPDGRGENRAVQVAAISKGLKALAKELNVVVLALSQLNRSVEQRADKMPQLSDLRDSGALEQDADAVLLLSREEEYKPETERKGLADLQIAKNRNGRTGKVVLGWNPETTGFRGTEYCDARL
jgi:replicative DNA helicase